MINPLRVQGEPCDHVRVVLDQEDRSVHCSKCGLVIDAFEILLREAEKNRREEGFLAKARGELASLHNEVRDQRRVLERLRKSSDNENRKVNRLIEQRKKLEVELQDAKDARTPPASGGFQLTLEAANAAGRFKP